LRPFAGPAHEIAAALSAEGGIAFLSLPGDIETIHTCSNTSSAVGTEKKNNSRAAPLTSLFTVLRTET
jgi:hypothetical protein